MLKHSATLLCIAALAIPAVSQRRGSESEETKTITAKTEGMKKHPGFFTFYWDAKAEHLWLEIVDWNTEFLHAISTASAVSGRDRGGWGGQRVLKFERSGSKVFLIESKFSYRAESDDPLERRAVDEAYTDPIVAGFRVGAEEDGRVLIDATDFFMKEGARGSVDKARSAFSWRRTANFPKNTEIEVMLTTTGGGGGGGSGRGGSTDPGRGRARGALLPENLLNQQQKTSVQRPKSSSPMI